MQSYQVSLIYMQMCWISLLGIRHTFFHELIVILLDTVERFNFYNLVELTQMLLKSISGCFSLYMYIHVYRIKTYYKNVRQLFVNYT